ncbi:MULTISPECIES: hypothetical protein [unclassified Sphingomonas]|uniref:hypothetical protein n=1 Tax=unclassified Sphingomonas TaxID=196159 RepID=UPI00226A22B2|nr:MULTISPECIES: hypothetical protein [unclassified Sphingomonas]
MIDPSFAFWYSFGGAVVMPFVEPLLWLPALVISRTTPSKRRFWLEMPCSIAFAFFVGWHENGFASMAGLDATVKLIQFARPALAAIFCALAARLLWKGASAIMATYRARRA